MFGNRLKNRFVSDYNLPIQVTQSPYFEYYLDLYEPYNQARTKYDELCAIIETHYNGNEHLFLEDYAKQRDKIITSIESSEEYQFFNKLDMSSYKIEDEEFNKLGKSSVYIEPNNGKTFISIDLRKANFQALKHYDPRLVSGKSDYDSFILHYLRANHPLLKYFQESKYSRQVIFGKLNMPRNITIQKYIMSLVFETLKGLMKEHCTLKYYSYCTDEIVIEVDTPVDWFIETIPGNIYDEIKKSLSDIDIKVEAYKLELVKLLTGNDATLNIYLKHTGDKKKIMCCPNTYFAQVYKLLEGKEVEENDMVFYYENQLAKFLKPLRVK